MDTPASQVSSDLLVPLASLNNTAAGSTTGSARELASPTNKKRHIHHFRQRRFFERPPLGKLNLASGSSLRERKGIEIEEVKAPYTSAPHYRPISSIAELYITTLPPV